MLFSGYLKAGFFVFTARSSMATHKTFILCLDAFIVTPRGYSCIRLVNCVQKHTH